MKLKGKLNYFLIALLCAILYGNTLNHDYVLDDFSVIKENFLVKQGTEGIPEIFKTHYRFGYGYTQANLYRPLSLSLFALQWEIAPDQPAFAHICSLILYILCSFLLFYFLKILFPKDLEQIALIACLLFIAHPIHTEVVANIKSSDDILALSFCLISCIAILKSEDGAKLKLKLLAAFSFFLALLSKESSVVFLGIIPLIYFTLKNKSILQSLKRIIYLIPSFLIFMIMRISVLGSFKGDKSIAKIDNLLMAAPNATVKMATAIKILGLYLQKLIFPHPLMNDYSMQQITLSDFGDWKVWLAFLIYAGLIFLFFSLRNKNPLLAFGIGLYLIAISLYSNLFITIGTSFGERLLFIPSIGFCIVLAILIARLDKGGKEIFRLKKAPLSASLLIVVLLLYSFKTIDRNRAWKDNFTLYSTDVENCDRSARCHYYYGLGLMKEKAITLREQQKRNELLLKATSAFSKSIEILPTYSDAYGQRGLAYFRLKQYDKALNDYQQAIKFNPQNATAYSNMGTLYFQMEKYQDAKRSFEAAIRNNPHHVDALSNYAATLGTMGEYQASISYYLKAIAIKPNEPSYYQFIGISYQNLGNQDQANLYFRKAKALQQQNR